MDFHVNYKSHIKIMYRDFGYYGYSKTEFLKLLEWQYLATFMISSLLIELLQTSILVPYSRNSGLLVHSGVIRQTSELIAQYDKNCFIKWYIDLLV